MASDAHTSPRWLRSAISFCHTASTPPASNWSCAAASAATASSTLSKSVVEVMGLGMKRCVQPLTASFQLSRAWYLPVGTPLFTCGQMPLGILRLWRAGAATAASAPAAGGWPSPTAAQVDNHDECEGGSGSIKIVLHMKDSRYANFGSVRL